jgi:hypothetical protein
MSVSTRRRLCSLCRRAYSRRSIVVYVVFGVFVVGLRCILAAHLDAHLRVSSEEIFWSLLMCIAGNSVAKIKSKFRRQISLDGIVKHFRPGISPTDGISKNTNSLILSNYRRAGQSLLHTTKIEEKVYVFCLSPGLTSRIVQFSLIAHFLRYTWRICRRRRSNKEHENRMPLHT